MSDFPVIHTKRLILRLFSPEDIVQLEQYADDKDILATTSASEVPQQGKIIEWIKIRKERYEKRQGIDFAIIKRDEDRIIGAIGLGFEYKNDESMQLGYWIGKGHWNQGYCTEAAREVLKYGFTTLGLHRIFSRAFTSNPASGRVLEKIGMKHEGTLREAYKHGDKFENMECYGLLKTDFIVR
jgi:ribosomal-protein-alanine N-acetyltransferase